MSSRDHHILAEILSRLPADAVVRTRAGHFRRVGSDAGLLSKLCSPLNPNTDGEFQLEIHSSFLENFLIDAEAFWARRGEGLWRSGLWIEGEVDSETPYEAIAVSLPTADALIIQCLDDSYESLQSVIQRARETSLERQLLKRELVLREELAACLLHDLRAPLSSIVGALSILKEPDLSSDDKAMLIDRALEQSSRQSAMIGRLLDVFGSELDELQAFFESGPEAPDLAETAARVADDFGPAFEKEQVRMVVNVDRAATRSTRVVGHRERLERIFTNLLENALRAAPANSKVTIAVAIDPVDPALCLATVSDQGSGVPAVEIPHLFDRLRRGRDPRRRGVSGLGLYFCRATAERWGGSMDYETLPTGGARFTLRLPLAR